MNIETVYYGPADAMIDEVGALDKRAYCNGGFYVLPVGDGQWDTEAFSTLAEAKAYALAEHGGAPIAYVC